MKKGLLLITMLCACAYGYAQQLMTGYGAATTTIRPSATGYTMQLQFGDVSLRNAEAQWKSLQIANTATMLQAGAPAMPYHTYSLATGNGAMQVTVTASSYSEFSGYDIVPSKGNLPRTVNPADVIPVPGPKYQENAFFPAQIASPAGEYMIRTAHGQALHVYPVQYNPVTHILRVYHSIELAITAAPATQPQEATAVWNAIYQQHFANYHLLPRMEAKTTYTPLGEAGSMLIITPSKFMTTLQPLIQWKQECGIRCYVQLTDNLPSVNEANIYNAIAQRYAQQAISYVLLVGDAMDVPPVNNASFGGPSDIAYGYHSGNDHYPDLMVGRFSANTVQELQPQVTRTISYEKNPLMTTGAYTRALGIGSNEGPGDDNEMDWEHMAGIRTMLLDSFFTYVYEAYDGTHSAAIAPLDGAGDPTAMEIVNDINSGLSLINYCGHGSSTSLGTSWFSNSDVPSLTNTTKWPFFITVACVTGEFMNGTSLGEAMMRAGTGTTPTGSIGGLMSSINQSWDPPMEAQDEFNAILTANDTVQLHRLGAMTVASCMAMNDAYQSAGDEMTDTWIFFGDPTVQMRYRVPTALTATHPDTLLYTATGVAVTANLPRATITLMHKDSIYSVQTANATGATWHMVSNIPIGDTLKVVATAPNTKPYTGYIRIVNKTTAVPVLTGAQPIALYPNPANSAVQLTGITQAMHYRCVDMQGRTLLQGSVDAQHTSINTASLATGSYFLQLEGDAGRMVLPLQILK